MDRLTITLFFHHSSLVCLNDLNYCERDYNNTEKVTAQREGVRTITLKDLSGSFSLVGEVRSFKKWSEKPDATPPDGFSCHSIHHTTHSVHLYLNCLSSFMLASHFIIFILTRKNPSYVSYCFHTVQELGLCKEWDINVLTSYYYLQTQAYNKLNRMDLFDCKAKMEVLTSA